jgi:hypothetical protein
MDADTVLWAAIALMTAHNSLTDINVIHGRYMLDAKQKLNIVLHQFVIIVSTSSVYFPVEHKRTARTFSL